MLEVEFACSYFGDCKPKYLKRFSEKTPEGNFIEGWICKKSNRYLGSLFIDTLNGEKHEQFVQSMPKIKYFNDDRDICLDYDVCVYSRFYNSKETSFSRILNWKRFQSLSLVCLYWTN